LARRFCSDWMWFAFFCDGERSVAVFAVAVDVDVSFDVDDDDDAACDDDDDSPAVLAPFAFDDDEPSCRALLFDGRESTGDARFVEVVGVREGVSSGDEEDETGGSKEE